MIYFTFFKGSLKSSISYSAKLYPFVTNETKVTLTCAGHVEAQLQNQLRCIKVNFYKNGQMLYRCVKEGIPILRLSCNVSITGFTSNNTFMCAISAKHAPCNAAGLSLKLKVSFRKENTELSQLIDVCDMLVREMV